MEKFEEYFRRADLDKDGRISGAEAVAFFQFTQTHPRSDNDSMLSVREFCIALYLMERYREGQNLPPTLPSNVLLDETLLSLTGPPNPSYRPAGWGANPGSAPQQPGMPGAQQMLHANVRPPMPGAQPIQYNQPKGPMPSMDNANAHQLSNGDQITSRSVALETTEAAKVVEDKKEILDSREKMAFYRNKMQDLVLYKSRCDNRLNEITERAIADKREAEMLAKKYEEKYKQVAELASKLTIEEASFRDIQGKFPFLFSQRKSNIFAPRKTIKELYDLTI